MNRKFILPALLLIAVLTVVGISFTADGIFAQGGNPNSNAPHSLQVLTDTSINDFNQGSLYHAELAPVDDGSVALQSIGLAGGWADTTSSGMPARFFHASVVVGNHIYAFGGAGSGGVPLATSYVTTIQANHTLSTWQAVTSLPVALIGPVAVAVNNQVYVMGGYDGTSYRDVVYRATVNTTDGTLSAWTQDAQNVPESLLHSGATAVHGFIYLIGGEHESPPASQHVYYTHPNADGSLASWTSLQDLPPPYDSGVSGHIVTSYSDGTNIKVFVATGFVGLGVAAPNVISANADRVTGALSSWTANVNYGQNLVYSAGTAYGTTQCGGNLYFGGGALNQNRLLTANVATSVLSAAPDYFAGGWYDTSNLGTPRYAHTMVASTDGWLYVIDGADSNGNPIASVRYGETACAAAGGSTRAPSGVFTSRTLDTNRQSSPFYNLLLNTSMVTGQPITLTFQYRFSNDSGFNGTTYSSPLIITPGISQTTSISLTNLSGQYFQYHVELARDNSALTSTPFLNWVSLYYEGNPPPATVTPGAVTPTPGATGGDLVIRQVAAQPSGTFRLVRGRSALLQASVMNVGTVAVPAGTRLEVDFYAGLTRPPVPADPSDTFGTITLSQPLQPGQEVVVQASWLPPHTGSYDVYGWVDRNTNLYPEPDYSNNITGPLRTCAYASDGQSFSDVPTNVYFYTPVEYLVCLNIISGYSDGTFKPYNNTTRQQFMKMVTLGMGWPVVTPTPTGSYSFTDMPPSSIFFPLVETTYAHHAVAGYNCGGTNPATGAAEPCDAARRPYFRPGNLVTRGQIAKILVVAKAWTLLNPTTPQFTDVAATSPFYQFIETAYSKGILGGYTTAAQCPSGVPCFLPANNATRGQISKMVYYTITQR